MKRLIILTVLFVCCWSTVVLADCKASSGSASLGSISSFSLASTAQLVETGSGFICSGSLLSLLSTNTVTGNLRSSANGIGNTARLYNASSGNYVPYTICTDSACSNTMNIGSSKVWSSTTLLGLLGLFNASDGSLPLYLKSEPGLNVAAGTYTDILTLNWNYSICFIGIAGLCVYTEGTATSTIMVTLDVKNDCKIDSAPDLNFGSASLPSSFGKISDAIGIRCTLNASYSINLTSLNESSGNWRQMESASGAHFLQYQLFRSDGTPWSVTNDLSTSGTGEIQRINYIAEVNPNQSNVPAGNYSDTVTVTVAY